MNKIKSFLYISKKINAINRKSIPMQIAYGVFTAFNVTVGLYFPKWIINEITSTKREEVVVLLAVLMVVSIYFTRFIAILLETYNSDYNTRNSNALKTEIGSKRMNVPFWMSQDTEELNKQEKAFAASKMLPRMSTNIYTGFTSSLIRAAITFYFLANVDWLCILLLTASAFFVYKANKGIGKATYEYDAKLTLGNRKKQYLNDLAFNIEAAKSIRLLDIKDFLILKYHVVQKETIGINKIKEKILWKQKNFLNFIDAFQKICMFFFLSFSYYQGKISIADFVIALPMLSAFLFAVRDLFEGFAKIGEMQYYVQDYRNFINLHNENKDTIDMPAKVSRIEFLNVSFHYPNSSADVLKDINLILNCGERIMIVGDNGSGKTTLVKLLLRLYEPTEGQILINGIDIQRFSFKDYIYHFTAVFQDFKLFDYSIRDNISINKGLTTQELFSVLRIMKLNIAVGKLKNGVDTFLYRQLNNEGKEFSGGEMQKIAICRAIVKNSEVGILDEPTASLDPIAERELFECYLNQIKGQTMIFISHRLAIAQSCEKIIVMGDHSVLETGSFSELMSNRNYYYGMYQKQASLYKNNDSSGLA